MDAEPPFVHFNDRLRHLSDDDDDAPGMYLKSGQTAWCGRSCSGYSNVTQSLLRRVIILYNQQNSTYKYYI